MPPPIRYPLPTLVALIVLSLAAWKGEAWTRPARAALLARVRRAVEGPPVPASARPAVVAGRATRRALPLRDGVAVSARPGGRASGAIDPRSIVEVFDVWPAGGPPTHLRVGHRAALGWVAAGDVLPWDTRLVVLAAADRLELASTPEAASGGSGRFEPGADACPVVGWTDRAVEVVVWDRAAPWSRVARRGWVAAGSIPPTAWAAWISDVELPIALRLAVGDEPGVARELAALGHLIDGQAWSPADRASSRPALPPFLPPAPASGSPPARQARERLAEANANPRVDSAWGGVSFRALPLDHFP